MFNDAIVEKLKWALFVLCSKVVRVLIWFIWLIIIMGKLDFG